MKKFVFPGKPIAQQRFRSITRGGKSWLFDPQSKEKRLYTDMAKDQIDENWIPPKYPRISFCLLMPIPKSMKKDEKSCAEQGYLKHVKKPDVDNIIKFYLDILTPSVIADDNCVQIGQAIKIYSKNPRTIIFIRDTDRLLTDEELKGF